MTYRRKEYIYNEHLSSEENLLLDRLYKLRLSHMAEALEKQFLNPNSNLDDFMTRVSDIINYECFLQVQIPEICRQKWRILHLRFGESCRLPGRIA